MLHLNVRHISPYEKIIHIQFLAGGGDVIVGRPQAVPEGVARFQHSLLHVLGNSGHPSIERLDSLRIALSSVCLHAVDVSVCSRREIEY